MTEIEKTKRLVNDTTVILEGGITELHIYPNKCEGVICLCYEDKKLMFDYPTFPFECSEMNSIEILRKSNGKVRLTGNFYNNGDSSFDLSHVILDVINVEEINT